MAELSKLALKAIDLIRDRKWSTTQQLAKVLKLSTNTASHLRRHLEAIGAVRRTNAAMAGHTVRLEAVPEWTPPEPELPPQTPFAVPALEKAWPMPIMLSTGQRRIVRNGGWG